MTHHVLPPPETPPEAADDAPGDAAPGVALGVAPEPVWLQQSRVRWGAGAAAALVVALWMLVSSDAGPAAPATAADAAMARAEWAAMMRRAPRALGAAGVRDTLGPGDAERTDGRFADYYTFTARDSTAFSVVVVSADFGPDLDVRRPDGVTVAGSALLRTRSRAEVSELRGPGRFEIVVTSREPGATGVYELAAGPAAAVDSLYADGPARSDTLGAGRASGVLRAGRFERVYGVVTGSDAPVVIRVVSPAFVPRLELLGPTGEVEGAWRTVETVRSDTLSGVVLRYLPGWDAPYRLVVSSASPYARGPFAVDVRTLPVRALPADGAPVAARLGDDSWLAGYRYVDTYKLTAREGMRTSVEVSSETVPPAFRLYRQDRRDDRVSAANANAAGVASVRTEGVLAPGDYLLEVTSGGVPADTTRAVGGDYMLTVQQTPLEPPAPRAPSPSAPAAAPAASQASRVFAVSAERTGTSGGSAFAVGVTQVAVSYPGARTRVQLSLSVRSVDYTGAWAPWESFARKASLTDDAGRRYAAWPSESVSPSGGTASPGTVRRGTVVFYTRGAATGQRRFTLVASIGESSVSLPIPVP